MNFNGNNNNDIIENINEVNKDNENNLHFYNNTPIGHNNTQNLEQKMENINSFGENNRNDNYENLDDDDEKK